MDVNLVRCRAVKDLMELVSAQADDISTSVVWMCLVLHLAHLSMDNRVEVRHSKSYASVER